VIETCTGPYWVLTAGPVKVPDFPAGALEVGGGVGFLVGVLLVGVVAGAVEWVTAGEDGALGALFFAAGFDGDALASSPLPFDEVIGDALAAGVAGVVLATAMPATWVL
jgi:hypothetical protein